MRIGEFADTNNVSIDTIRYYMDLNLIHPFRKGKYFYFENQQRDELRRLLLLKKLKFTLDEIKKMVTVQELNKIKTVAESSIYKDMLLKKRETVRAEISELSEILYDLDTEIKRAAEANPDNYKDRGLAFSNLEMLCCPVCGRDFEISDGILKGNGIYEGASDCPCGFSLSISQGIIVTKHDSENIIEPYSEDLNYIDHFVNEAPKDYVDFMINASKTVIRLLMDKKLSDKSLLFMKSGLGILEAGLLELFQDIKLMVLVDDDYNKLRIAKKSIETKYPKSNVLYICSEFDEIPVRKAVIDIGVDFLASFINGFKAEHNPYEYVIPMLKPNSSIIGLYLYFKSFDMISRMPEAQRCLFDGKTIPYYIKSKKYVETSDYEEIVLHEGSNINDFFKKGDKVHSKIIIYERKN